MIIGIDIDGVLMDDDTYRLDHITKYCYENQLPDMDNPYAYEEKCEWEREISEDYREKYFFNYIKNAPIRDFAAEVIQKLHDEGNKIVIITGRYKTQEDSEIGKQMRKDTEDWLNKNNIIYDEICYAHCPKTKEIIEKNIDIMIDDSPEILPEIVKVTKVLCYDNRYNRDLEYNNMTRVFSWYDIYMKINLLTK